MPDIIVTYTKTRTYLQDAEEFFQAFPLLENSTQEEIQDFIEELMRQKGSKGRGANLFDNFTPVKTERGSWHVDIPPIPGPDPQTPQRTRRTKRNHTSPSTAKTRKRR